MPDKNFDGTRMMWNFDDGRQVPVNRFQLMSRLGQTYVVGNFLKQTNMYMYDFTCFTQ